MDLSFVTLRYKIVPDLNDLIVIVNVAIKHGVHLTFEASNEFFVEYLCLVENFIRISQFLEPYFVKSLVLVLDFLV